jgi:hypothetical protein
VTQGADLSLKGLELTLLLLNEVQQFVIRGRTVGHRRYNSKSGTLGQRTR